ncbi:Co2+/Mg2+ efflux protein ApaG [Chromatiales bacterium (ex Bugula neritina AB1)]|nr:Co2+/Mg2+ efflux protein ApaG [Chromatiales bacterium (ex Bugula neritina AB1)]
MPNNDDSTTPTDDDLVNKIKVEVATRYLESDSDPEDDRFVFAYTITILNQGEAPARLLTRHWVITHGNGRTQEVRGEGVVGEQPRIKPGEGYQYTSGTILDTPIGTMGGSYQMVTDDGIEFDASIPEFLLSTPRTLH